MIFTKLKKYALVTLISLAFIPAMTAQEALETETATAGVERLKEENASEELETAPQEQEAGRSHKRIDFVTGIFPSVYINTESKLISSPSPVFMPLRLGVTFPTDSFIEFAPSISIFYNYYLVHEGLVLPAEIENRTGTGCSILLNLPALFSLDLKKGGRLELFAGAAFLLRFATVSANVGAEERGFYGTAAADVAYMNKWFYQNLRFLYLSVGADYLFEYKRIRFGPELSLYLPIAGFFADKSAAGIIAELGFKVTF